MKCDRHIWDTDDKDWCWKCEEITINENKKRYEDKFRDNSLQRIGGDTKTDSISTETQETN